MSFEEARCTTFDISTACGRQGMGINLPRVYLPQQQTGVETVTEARLTVEGSLLHGSLKSAPAPLSRALVEKGDKKEGKCDEGRWK